MKKLTLLMLLCMIESAECASYLTGFYLKGGLGGTTAEFDITQDVFLNDPDFFGSTLEINQSVNHLARGTNIAGVLGLGYTYQLDSLWVIGGEFTAGFTSANTTFHNNGNTSGGFILNNKVESKLTNDFALVVKPGLVIQQRTQFYALLGARWGNIETKSNSNTEVNFGGSSYRGNGSASASGYILGFTVGLGVERMLNEHWSLGLEYAYTAYGDIPSVTSDYTTSGTIPSHAEVTNDVTGTAAANTVILDAAYRF